MKERPILFSAPMVRAILEGRKTVTRRVVKPAGAVDVVRFIGADNQPTGEFGWCQYPAYIEKHIRCPYGQPGDRLWVRESHRLVDCTCTETCRVPGHVWYESDSSGYGNASMNKLRPSIHMPRWASRITLEVTGVRVERLHDISKTDAIAEGIETNHAWPGGFFRDYMIPDEADPRALEPHDSFRSLWQSINGADSWDANPWVWVVEFARVQP